MSENFRIKSIGFFNGDIVPTSKSTDKNDSKLLAKTSSFFLKFMLSAHKIVRKYNFCFDLFPGCCLSEFYKNSAIVWSPRRTMYIIRETQWDEFCFWLLFFSQLRQESAVLEKMLLIHLYNNRNFVIDL